MPIANLDPDKCKQRNRIAARRDGVNAVPVQFLRPDAQLTREVETALGTLPASEAEALARINSLQPDGATPLTADDVWVHYCEAANDNFIGDRFMFLDRTTLRNIAKDAEAGAAFMNSHRTGGLSHASELPFGRTFCGRYEEYRDDQGRRRSRTIVGFFMLRGIHPNGQGGPGTDDLHRMIDGGTLFDVSVGLWPGASGDEVCDVCGSSLYGYDEQGRMLCPHIPGTHRAMSAEQKSAQEGRGVTQGYCSFTLVDYRMGEVSGVYDGAVPGAGFRKGLAHFAKGELDGETLAQCRQSYGTLLGKRDFAAGKEGEAPTREQITQALSALFGAELNPADEELPAGLSFEDELTTVLAAVQSCTDRGETLRQMREKQGRSLSAARVAQLTALHEATGELLAACQPAPTADRAVLSLKRQRRTRAVEATGQE